MGIEMLPLRCAQGFGYFAQHDTALPSCRALVGVLLRSPNMHQLHEKPINSVGARVVERGRVGLYGRPRPVRYAHLWREGDYTPHRATIKALPTSTQPPSPLRYYMVEVESL